MKVNILGWSYSGIRGVNNLDINVEMQPNEPYRTSLIMMPNGTGKTTTITLMRAIFDGSAELWSSNEVRQFQPTDEVREGHFSMNLLIDNKAFRVSIHLDYVNGQASYSTSRAGDRGGLNKGHNLPYYVKEVFTQDFVKRFVFDGELAKDILNSGKDEAEQAIKFLYHLNRLSDLQTSIDRIVTEEQKKSEKSQAKTTKGLNQIRNQLQAQKMIKEQLLQEVEKLENEKRIIQSRIDEIHTKLEVSLNKDESIRKELAEYEEKLRNNEIAIKDLTTKLLDELRNPNFINPQIAQRLTGLSNKMQELKLPRTMSRQFFEELAEQEYCICNREITREIRQIILTKSTEYLAEDQIGVINSIKQSVKNRDYNDTALQRSNLLREKIEIRYDLKSEWGRIDKKRKELADSEDQRLLQELENLNKKLDDINKQLEEITTEDKDRLINIKESRNLHLVESKIEELTQKYLEATHTVNLAKSAERLKSHIHKIEQRALQGLKQMIKEETNIKLQQIIKSETLYVEDIDKHLVLRGKSGSSEGQSLAIAYSYLGSLFHASSHDLPFVVDSPAGALDLSVRREVSRIIPELFNQLIIFITSGEREGFTEHFYTRDGVQFLTIYLEPGLGTISKEGPEFFRIFQEEEVKAT